MNRGVQMTDALECGARRRFHARTFPRPVLASHAARPVILSASFARRTPLQSFRHHPPQIVIPLALSEARDQFFPCFLIAVL